MDHFAAIETRSDDVTVLPSQGFITLNERKKNKNRNVTTNSRLRRRLGFLIPKWCRAASRRARWPPLDWQQLPVCAAAPDARADSV